MEHFLRLSIFKRGQLLYSMDTSPFAEEVWTFLEVSQVLAYRSTEPTGKKKVQLCVLSNSTKMFEYANW